MYNPMRHALFAASCVCLLGDSAIADAKPAYGWVEKATIAPWGTEVKVKLDSGALTSSMQAEDIEAFERDGEDWVRFTVVVGVAVK